MPIDRDAQAYLIGSAARGFPAVSTLSPQEARRVQREKSVWTTGEAEPIERVYDRLLPGADGAVPVRIYIPEATDRPLPMLAYFHGGGWVLCDLDTHDVLCRAIARRAGCLVVAVDYPLAPEHKFPAGLEACWSVTKWLALHGSEIGGDPSRLAVGGDSAGGNLATVVALRAAKDRGPTIAFQLLIYPSTDASFDQPSHRENAAGYGLTAETLRYYFDHYLSRPADAFDPEVSPLRAEDLTGVAPAFVVTCEFDLLRDEGEQYARRLADAGVQVISRRFDGQIHGFVRATGVIKESWSAIDEIASALRSALG